MKQEYIVFTVRGPDLLLAPPEPLPSSPADPGSDYSRDTSTWD